MCSFFDVTGQLKYEKWKLSGRWPKSSKPFSGYGKVNKFYERPFVISVTFLQFSAIFTENGTNLNKQLLRCEGKVAVGAH